MATIEFEKRVLASIAQDEKIKNRTIRVGLVFKTYFLGYYKCMFF
jgi:hypothetical protein